MHWFVSYLLRWDVVPNISSQLSARRGRDCERGRKFLRSELVYKGCHLPLTDLSICSEKMMGKMNWRSCWDYCWFGGVYFAQSREGWMGRSDLRYSMCLESFDSWVTLWWAAASSEACVAENTAVLTYHISTLKFGDARRPVTQSLNPKDLL